MEESALKIKKGKHNTSIQMSHKQWDALMTIIYEFADNKEVCTPWRKEMAVVDKIHELNSYYLDNFNMQKWKSLPRRR